MNWIVITIGMALVLALAAAVVGPMVVDWTVYRATIEAQATRALGADVRIGGDIDVRLLPSPRVALTDVAIGPADAPLLTAAAVDVDVALSPLLSREVRILTLSLDRPVATLRIAEDGGFSVPTLAAPPALAAIGSPQNVTIEALSLADGTLTVEDERTGARHTLAGLTLAGQARSLLGPFTLRGTVEAGEREMELRLAGGSFDNAAGTLPLSIRLAPGDGSLSLSFDGALTPSLASPKLTGTLDAATQAADGTPISLSGAFALTPERMSLARAPLRYGEGDTAVEFTTTALYRLAGDTPLVATVEARQLDLDRLANALRGAPLGAPPPENTLAPRDALGLIRQHFAPLVQTLGGAAGPRALAEFNVGTVVFGGSVVRDLSVALHTGERITVERAEALFPGDTSAELTGEIAGGFEGRLRLSSAAPAAVARWWSGVAATASTANADPVRLDAQLIVTDDAVELPHLQLRLGQSSATGRARIAPGDGTGRDLVELSFGSSFVDANDAATAAALLSGGTGFSLADTDLVLNVRLERVRVGTVEGDAVNLKAQHIGGTLTIDALVAEDLAGAEVLVSGDISNLAEAPVGIITGSLALNDGARLSEAVRSLAPSNAQAERLAVVLSRAAPGRLSFSLAGGGADSAGSLSARLNGDLAGTAVALDALGTPFADDAPLSLSLTLQSETAPSLLGQLGIPVADDPRLNGAARLALEVDGEDISQLFATLDIEALGAAASFEGGASFAGGDLGLNGALTLSAQSMEPFVALAGRPLPLAGPVLLAAELATEPDGSLAVDDLTGTIDDVPLSGSINVAGRRLSGALTLGTADLAALSSLILGTDAWRRPAETDTLWPTTAFTAPPFPAVDLALDINAETLTIGAGTAENAAFWLSLSPTALTVRDLNASLSGGTLSGEIRLTRDGNRADLGAKLSLSDLALADVIWTAQDAPVATGALSATLEAASSGYTVADLVANLTGSGDLTVADGTVTGFTATPFDIAALDLSTPEPPDDAAVRDAVRYHLAAGTLAFAEATAPLALAAGTLRADTVTAQTAAGPVRANATFDLPAWQMSAHAELTVASDRDDAPLVAVNFAGPIDAPARTVDISALTAWINLVQLENQVRAVEEQNEELAAEADAVAPEPDAAPAPAAPSPPDTTPTADPAPERESRLYRQRIIDELRDFAGAASDAPTATRAERLSRAQPFNLTPEDVANSMWTP